jgi:hypothetical protein
VCELKNLDGLPEILTASHISEYLKISRRRVYELLKMSPDHGGIPNFDIGHSKRVEKSDFIQWIHSKKQEKKAQFN